MTYLPTRRPRERLFTVAAIAAAALVGIGLYLAQRPSAPPPVSANSPATTAPAIRTTPPVATVVDAARELKLVTYSFTTTIDAAVLSDRWYGDASANVRAPVRYQYGVDLETLRADNVFYDSIGRRYVFVVAAPARIAAEVDLDRMESELAVTGMRWRSRNQDKLDQARAEMAERARTMTLSPEDERKLIDVSREQLESLLRRVLNQSGEDAAVTVRFGS